MKCPQCEIVELTMADRAGIEVDTCTTCRGVWLDRGELDKIIERAAKPFDALERPSGRKPLAPGRERDRFDGDDDHDHHDRRKRRGGFLEELFDF